MSLSATRQALSAAFTFGIVFNSASAALFLCIQGQGTKVFRDGLRLVLITFLASSALWAQTDFIATLVDPSSPLGCQVAVIFASSFDQIARLAIEQYLLWAINSGVKPSPDTFIPQALLFIRLLVGGIFVAFQRPQLLPVCQPSNNMVAIGIAVAATDAVIIAIFVLRAFMTGLVQDFREKRPGFQRAKAVLLLIAGLALWTGASVPLFLGLQSIDIIWRTALPAGALSILLGLIAVFLGPLVLTRARASAIPQDATSPRDDFQDRSSHVRDISSSESNYPPNRYEDLKTGTTTSITATRALNAGTGFATPQTGAVIGAAVGGTSWQARGSPDEMPQSAQEYQRSRANVLAKSGPLAGGITIGKLAISHPILQKLDEDSPFHKIATIDLATAARNEKERRNLATLQDPSALIAQRAAPQPPAITAEEAMKRSQSKMKRKEIVPAQHDTAESQQFEDTTRLLPTATATSSQASPGMESLRRRSPRQSPRELPLDEQEGRTTSSRGSPLAAQWQPTTPGEDRLPSRRSMGSPSTERTAVPSISDSRASSASPSSVKQMGSPPRPELPPTWPKQDSVRNTIRPSRMQASVAQAVPTLPQQQTQQGSDASLSASQMPPPLQRRGTVGLPSNPRAHGMKAPGKDGGSQPTVLFMNQIQYNNPAAVQSIIDGATGQVVVKMNAEAGALPEMAKARDSVVHRPRPIPRQQDSDRQLFPSEQSPRGHVRNRSGGSITSRKSILRSTPGSPTQLPALPPLPKSAGQPSRPQPNDTRSMTFNEKMELFFPGAPKTAGPTATFRGSIPSLPPLPAAYATEKNKSVNQGSDVETAQRALSKRSIASSQQTSLRTQSIFEIDEAPVRVPDIRNTSKFSVDTYTTVDRIAADDVHDSWIPIMPERPRSQRSYEGSRRRSSPVIPVMESRMSEISDARTRDEEATTNWGSIHSPVAAVNIKQARQIPVSTYIQNPDSGRDPRNVSIMDPNDGKEVMTIMLDASIEHDRSMATASWFDERQHPDNLAASGGQWHHRVGDECTTFSARKERVVSRRMPPPTPLLLNSTSKNSIIVAAEPSPLDSPQEAYEVIQQQLKRLDELDKDPIQSESERLRLLESLEQEMGQQEYQWHEMQNGLSRDSVSTVETKSSRHSEAAMANVGTQARQSQSSSIAADRRASRRARLESSTRPSRDSAAETISSGTSSRRESRWQQKLAEAEHEYAENAADLMAKPFLNFLSVSVPKGQLGSPTPPDTDESDSEDLSSRAKAVLARKNAPHAKLWKPTSPELPTQNHGLLWAAPARIRPPVAPEDLPGLSVRPFAWKASDTLKIESTRLWNRRNSFTVKPHSVTIGLWRGAPIPAPAQQVNVRPVTQRPPRKNKRVTLLPDIIESPKELPDKRGTLGIFQFPWGEKSDTATVQTRPTMFMAMPGTMSSGGPAIRAALEARAKQLEAQEYSASFFDDYDDEEDEASSDDDYDYQEDDEEDVPEYEEDDSDYNQEGSDEEDDDFDESTLWEIASLLKSDQVPSKNSLLPQPHRQSEPSVEKFFFEALDFEGEEDIVEEQTYEQADGLDSKHDSGSTAFDVDDFPAPPRAPTLWTDDSREATVSRGVGLPEVDEHTWSRYVPSMEALPRSRPKAAEPATIQSTTLWSTTPVAPVETPEYLLWAAPKLADEPISKTLSSPQSSLWCAMATVVTEEPSGLYSPSHDRSEFRTTTAEPAAKQVTRRPRVFEESLAELPSSSSLWIAKPSVPDEPMWMLAASTAQAFEEPETELKVNVEPHVMASVPDVGSPRVASQLLWAAPARSVDDETSGLFDTSFKRHDYRTTTASPAALLMVRKPRLVVESPLEISPSALLWDQAQPTINATDRATRFWIASAPAVQNDNGNSTPRSLWTAPAVVARREPVGLYQMGLSRTSFRTTSAEPAALETPRRPRINQEPMPRLSSSELWKRQSVASYEYDWISIASVGPQSPSYASSSGRSTPTSESASLKTTSTKASSLAISINHAILKDSFPGPPEPTWWEEPKLPALSDLPEDVEVTFDTADVKTPTLARPFSTEQPTENVLRRVAEASAADWDAQLLDALAAGGTHQQEQKPRHAATQSQWDDALSQAIKAGRPRRRQITAAEWDLALEEALSAGSKTFLPSQGLEENVTMTEPALRLQESALWFQHSKETVSQGPLWTRSATATQTPDVATSIESRTEDLETQRLRRKRVQALIPKSRKAEIRRQIAAIEAGADPATVGLVNFSGHSLWAREDADHAWSNTSHGQDRDWLRL